MDIMTKANVVTIMIANLSPGKKQEKREEGNRNGHSPSPTASKHMSMSAPPPICQRHQRRPAGAQEVVNGNANPRWPPRHWHRRLHTDEALPRAPEARGNLMSER
eukprot:scaffold66158_cov52-Prasinocladus_malaysianus.AAC.1